MYVPRRRLSDAADEAGRHLLLARAAVAATTGSRRADRNLSRGPARLRALRRPTSIVVHLVRLDRGSSRHRAGASQPPRRPSRRSRPIVTDAYGGFSPSTRARARLGGCLPVQPGERRGDSRFGASSQISGPRRRDSDELADASSPASPDSRRWPDWPSEPGQPTQSDSPGESVSRVQFFRFGDPSTRAADPRVRHARRARSGFADFYWKECRHLGEFDGKAKYEKYLRPGETAADCVFREKRREDRMRVGSAGACRGSSGRT